MATAKKKRNKDSGSNDSVIASRILQDIINNSSESFRTFLQQQGIGGDIQAVPMAGGGPTRAPEQGPVQGPPATAAPITDIEGARIPPPQLGPLQGPPADAWKHDPRHRPGYGMLPLRGAHPDQGIRMPVLVPPDTNTPMPNPTEPWGPVYEDGSQAKPRVVPGDWNWPRLPLPQSMSILDLLGIR